jgi:hypothetical protein
LLVEVGPEEQQLVVVEVVAAIDVLQIFNY